MSTRRALAKFTLENVWPRRPGKYLIRCVEPPPTNYPVKDCFDIKKIPRARDRGYYGSVPIGIDCNNFYRVPALRNVKTMEERFLRADVCACSDTCVEIAKGHTLNVRSAFGEE